MQKYNHLIGLIYIFDEKMSNAYVWMEWQMYETARGKFEKFLNVKNVRSKWLRFWALEF